MRLCVVSGTFHPEPGGPPTYLYHLLPELVRRGHEVCVVTYGDRGEAPETYPYPVWRITRRWPIPIRLLLMTLRVLAEARDCDRLFVSDYGLPAALANLVLRKPMVLKNVGDFAWEFSTRHRWIPPEQTIGEFQSARHSWRVRFLRAMQAAYARAADAVLAPSHFSAGLIAGWGVPPEKVRVIYNALDREPFADLPSRSEARVRLGLPEAAPLAVCVARLAPWKNVGALVRAWPEVRSRLPEARLIIVGDGPSRGEWESQAARSGEQGAVRFVGAQTPEKTRLHLRAAAVFVLYSKYEGLPHVVLEAMAAGTPVVVSDAGGNLEAVEHEVTGLVAPLADESALAASIVRLLTDRALAHDLTTRAMVSLERFSWDGLVKETERALVEAALTPSASLTPAASAGARAGAGPGPSPKNGRGESGQ